MDEANQNDFDRAFGRAVLQIESMPTERKALEASGMVTAAHAFLLSQIGPEATGEYFYEIADADAALLAGQDADWAFKLGLETRSPWWRHLATAFPARAFLWVLCGAAWGAAATLLALAPIALRTAP